MSSTSEQSPTSVATATPALLLQAGMARLLRSYTLEAFLLLFVLLLGLVTLMLPAVMALDVGTDGSRDVGYMRGIYGRERVETRTFRWARGDAEIILPAGRLGSAVFQARFHSAPRPGEAPLPVVLHIGDHRLDLLVAQTQRTYMLLLPEGAAPGGVWRLRLDAPTYTPPGDDRLLALAFDRIGLRQLGAAAIPAWQLVAGEVLLVAGLLACLYAAGAPRLPALGAALLVALLIGWLNLSQRLWMTTAAWPYTLTILVLATATLAVRYRLLSPSTVHRPPPALPFDPSASLRAGKLTNRVVEGSTACPERSRRVHRPPPALSVVEGSTIHFAWALWRIFLGAVALRLFGVLAPGFEFRDLDIQSHLLNQVLGGRIYLTVPAHEWGGAMTFYPSGPYLLLLPLLLILPSLAHTLHIGAALADGCAPLLLALVARELGASRVTALFAAALLAGLPIQFTAIWWGFYTNLAGQTLLLLLLLLLLRFLRTPVRSQAWLLGLALVLVLLSHVGVLLLAGVTLGLAAPVVWLQLSSRARRTLLLTVGGVALFFLVTYISLVIGPMFTQAGGVFAGNAGRPADETAEIRAYILRIIPVALWRGLVTLPALALVPGLLLLWQHAPGPFARGLLLCWAAPAPIFFAVEYVLILQVRYIYYIAPLACLALAVLISSIRLCGRVGRIVSFTCLLLIITMGVLLWFNGALLGYKPSLVPLTH